MVAIGGANCLFAGQVAGDEHPAAIYSVIETAKFNGIEPQAHIADVIAKDRNWLSGPRGGMASCRENWTAVRP